MAVADKQALIERYISTGRPSALPDPIDARLRDYGVHVWALIEHMRLVQPDPRKLATEFEVPYEAVKAALAYYEQHRERIDARILLNSPA